MSTSHTHHAPHTPHTARSLVKKLEANTRLAASILARAPSFKVTAGSLADNLHEVLLSNGENVHLHLPAHTHLNPGDVLLDTRGMMVRVDAAAQAVLAITHPKPHALITLALAAQKQGRALGWNNDALLLAHDEALAHYLENAGFVIQTTKGILDLPLEVLPLPEHHCAHPHTTEPATHSHSHDHNH